MLRELFDFLGVQSNNKCIASNSLYNVLAECCILILPPQPLIQALAYDSKLEVDSKVFVTTSLNTCESNPSRRSLMDVRDLQSMVLVSASASTQFTKRNNPPNFLDLIFSFLMAILNVLTFGLLG